MNGLSGNRSTIPGAAPRAIGRRLAHRVIAQKATPAIAERDKAQADHIAAQSQNVDGGNWIS
ncbi:hypothetical protein [Vannielia litorea]|uniref:hypothetical protein n=1 Tax=Vannielia litorea TaxID=1217970 RepID=UPI00111543E2|nr:hypothetical protein [Vannielia litorea]